MRLLAHDDIKVSNYFFKSGAKIQKINDISKF